MSLPEAILLMCDSERTPAGLLLVVTEPAGDAIPAVPLHHHH